MWKECPAEHIQYTLQRSVTSLHARWMGGGGGEAKTAGIALPLKVKQSHNVPRTITFTYGWLTRHHNCQLMIGGSSRFVKSKLMAKSDKIPETVCVPGMPDNLSKIRHIILPPLALSPAKEMALCCRQLPKDDDEKRKCGDRRGRQGAIWLILEKNHKLPQNHDSHHRSLDQDLGHVTFETLTDFFIP